MQKHLVEIASLKKQLQEAQEVIKNYQEKEKNFSSKRNIYELKIQKLEKQKTELKELNSQLISEAGGKRDWKYWTSTALLMIIVGAFVIFLSKLIGIIN